MRSTLAATLLLLACSCAEAPPTPELGRTRLAAGASNGWVGTWAVAPQGDGTTFQDKTLRQIVHTSIAGTSVRIRVSNVFGNQPLALDSVYIAEQASGSAIVPATSRQLKFGGQGNVTIAAGQTATSDAQVFDVRALSNLAISFHLAGSSGPATAHGLATQDNYVASGNVATQERLDGAQTRGSYFFLTNLDVLNPGAWGAVVTLGASITDGVQSSQNANRRWPNYLAQRLADDGLPVGVLNQGISGNKLLLDGAGESALKRFERDVLSQTGVRWVIFSDDPINDLGAGNPPTGPQLIDALEELVAKAHAADIEFWCSTLTPFQGSGGWKDQGETARAAIHAFIESPDSGCDAVVDQDSATHDPAKPTWYLPAYDAGDHLHPNEQGMQAIADAIDLAGFSALPSAGDSGGETSEGGAATGGSGSGSGGSSAGADAPGAGGIVTAGSAGSNSATGGGRAGAATSGASGAGKSGSPEPVGADSGCSCSLPCPAQGGARWNLLLPGLLAFVGFRRLARG